MTTSSASQHAGSLMRHFASMLCCNRIGLTGDSDSLPYCVAGTLLLLYPNPECCDSDIAAGRRDEGGHRPRDRSRSSK